jgi:hypothetical protein
MPISNSRVSAYREQWASAVTQLVGATTYGPFFSGPFTRARFVIDRTASTGAETMDAKLQYLDATGDQVDLLDHAGNAIAWVQWADDSHVTKVIEVGPGTLASDADDVLLVSANRYYGGNLPESIYVVVTGASGTDDTFSAYIDWLP